MNRCIRATPWRFGDVRSRYHRSRGVFECSTIEAVEHVAEVGFDGFEFFDWEEIEIEELDAAAEKHDVEVFGTLSAGAGANLTSSPP